VAIQYATGTVLTASFTQITGTRAELADWIQSQLVLAGWATAGSASDYQLTTVTTPQGLAGRARVYDPGSGNCTRVKFSNTAGSVTQAGDLFLLPAAAKLWRIIANGYQFFLFTPGVSAAREFACGGVPWVPTFLGITECFWGMGNVEADAGATVRESFRTRLAGGSSVVTPANQVGVVNGSKMEANNAGAATVVGSITVGARFASIWNNANPTFATWWDSSWVISEAILGWSTTTVVTGQPRWVGQIWDAIVLPGQTTLASDSTISFDGHSWWVITAANTGSSTNLPGNLLIAIN